MKLLKSSGDVVRWVMQAIRQFFRVSRGATVAVVVYLTVARATRMLAFLLPLKVILLAGSDGVPHYFRAFMSPEHKNAGVVALSVAAIVSYALTLLLEARSRRLSERGSADLLAASGVMPVIANRQGQMHGFYARFTQVASAALFAGAGLLGFLVLDPLLAFYLLGLCLCFYLLTAWALRGVTALNRNRLSDLVTERLGSYLDLLSSAVFLSSFLVILLPLIAGAGGNILVAIVCVVLLRQMLSAMTGAIRDVVALAGQRPLIDTLVFPQHRLQLSERKAHRTLRELFGRQDREGLVAAELAGLAQPGQSFRVEWRDPLLPGTADFAVALEGGAAAARHFRQRVFPPRFRHMVENEDLLFSHVGREAVWAPPLVGRFFHGEHECLVWDAATGRAPAGKQWRAVEDDFLANLWAFEPPAALANIYASSHSFLHQRLTDDFAARMDVAVDSDAGAAALERFRQALPAIRDMLAGMPLRLVNPDFRRDGVVARAGGGFYVAGWGQWSLEPIGAGEVKLPAAEDRLAVILDLARARHPAAIPASVDARHLLLAHRCGRLERAVLRGMMKEGLALAGLILADLDSPKRTSTLTSV